MQYQTFSKKHQKLIFTRLMNCDLSGAIKSARSEMKLHGLDPDDAFTCLAPKDITSKELARYGIVWNGNSSDFE